MSTLSEFKGYAELTDFREISSKCSIENEKQTLTGKF